MTKPWPAGPIALSCRHVFSTPACRLAWHAHGDSPRACLHATRLTALPHEPRLLQVGLLRRLLAAGAHPVAALLPVLLRRYDGSMHSDALADKLRLGMREVLAHALPPQGLHGSTAGRVAGAAAAAEPPSSASVGSGGVGVGSATSAAGGAGGGDCADVKLLVRVGQRLFTAKQAHQLLAAAVACRDEARCRKLLAGLAVCQAGQGGPWADPEANCALLVSAAAHDMPAVVEALLAVPPAVEGGQVRTCRNGWAGLGCGC